MTAGAWIAAGTALVLTAMTACVPDGGADDPPEPLIGVSRFESLRAACVLEGGTFAPRGDTTTYVCYRPTGDANAACTASSQCESLCLARSQTCAPIAPVAGCVDELTESGAVATVCFE